MKAAEPVWQGHLLAFIAILIWGMTYISSKVLVGLIDPYWYLIFRFSLAWLLLFLLSPKPMALLPKKQEGYLILCGLAGVTLYYILQNVALLYTSASNASVITATAPLFTALILWLCGRRVRLTPLFFLGFVLCIGGIAIISFGGGGGGLHLTGDLFTLASAVSWGVYCILIARTAEFPLSSIQVTRKVFFWGTVLTLPAALLLGSPVPLATLTHGGLALWGNLLFVALCSSALCYLCWGRATALVGSVTTSVYLYLMPVVSVIGSVILLDEAVTPITILAIAAILVGLLFSQKGNKPA